MVDAPPPRPARSQSSSRGVAVAASQKTKPKNAPFKFLRKDEGRLSYTCQADSPVSGNNHGNQFNISGHNYASRDSPSSERRVSRSLREAIANDMRKGKNQDPFAAVVIAVPKRSPPPNPAARDEAQGSPDPPPLQERRTTQRQQQQQQQPQQQQQQQQQQQAARKLELVVEDQDLGPNGGMETTSKPRQRSRSSEDPERSTEALGQRSSANPSHPTPRRSDDYDDMEWQRPPQRRYRGEEMMLGNGISRKSPARRYLDPVGHEEDYPRSSRNFFVRPQRQGYRSTREEENLVEQLEEELQAAQEERGRYQQLKLQLERDRKRFEDYRVVVEQEIEDERAELDAARASDKWQAKKDVKVVEERYKSTLELLKSERESNKKLTQENELLRQQLEGMTTHMRETQKLQKAETSRLRREIESLTRRNEELLEMTREQQIAALESSSKVAVSVPPLQIASNAWRHATASTSSTGRSSEENHVVPEVRSTAGNSIEQQHTDTAWGKKQKRLNEEKARKRLEAEKKEEERKRLEAEEKEKEKERKRLEAEEKEKEKERKRLEAEEKEKERSARGSRLRRRKRKRSASGSRLRRRSGEDNSSSRHRGEKR
ncbi:centromere protein J [Trypanosoma conorhini]|uniref:Centromere protein J n=1 Tax=Trypanosoma conorhini TaxID=83891 RepID=A0A422PM87_9TRYP|nr:centromere protein J [Trypanosoma conorhini]RNF18798.1 centromere protein J [Trypanosoma conorhini]